MKKNRAFTLMEGMIVVAIAGLLAAMAIPAFVKVRDSSIVKRGDAGQVQDWNKETWDRYRKLKAEQPGASRAPANSSPPSPSFSSLQYKRLTIEGKTYILVPKQIVGESQIEGQHYYIIPE